MSDPESSSAPPVSILVGVSYDDTGENALRAAMEMARWRSGARFHIAHILPDSALANRTANVEQHFHMLEAHPRRLAEFVEPFLPTPRPAVTIHVRVGDPARALLQLAVDVDAEVLVVGTHGRRGLERLALGSVARELLDARRCPVVVAAPRNFAGLSETRLPEPECPACAQTRKASEGREGWCPQHAKVRVPTSLRLEDGAWVPAGGNDPGLVA